MTTSRRAVRSRRPIAVALAAFLLTTSASAQTQWVVDAAGGGDFTDLQAGIDGAAAGDVLLVLPGNYGAAVLGKRLSILGDPSAPRPVVASLEVQAAPAFTLTHLDLRRLRVVDVPERSVVDDCRVRSGCFHDFAAGTHDLVLLDDAADMVLSRCVVHGEWSSLDVTCDTVRVVGGSLQIVGCTIEGDSFAAPFPSSPTWGTDAVRLEDGASAWIVASVLRGGDGAHAYGGSGGGAPYAGRALFVESGARADVRGSSEHLLEGGVQLGANPSDNQEAVACEPGAGPIVLSGVTVDGVVGTCVEVAAVAAPFLRTGGADGPGLVREVAVTGAAGSVAVLVAALGSGALELPWLGTTPLWLAPGSEFALVPLALAGPGAPAAVTFLQPPTAALAGVQVHVQAFEITALGAVVGTNAGVLVLTF